MVESKKTQLRLLIGILLLLTFVAKTVVTGVNHWRIIDAIYAYRHECIVESRQASVNYADMEEYNESLWRLWDWSDRRILSAEDYKIIKPYIGQVNSSEFAGQYLGG